MRSAVLLAVLVVAGAAFAAKPDAPAEVVRRFEAALNAGNAEEAAALFADDAHVATPLHGAAAGRDQVRAWAAGLIAKRFRADSGARAELDGGTVRWVTSLADERLRALKLAPLEASGEAVVRGGKIVSFTPRLPSSSQLKLRDALAAEAKAAVRALLEDGLGKGDAAAVDRVVAEGFQDHDPFPGQPATREGVKAGFAGLREAFPDLSVTVVDAVAEGEKVAARFELKGTNTGPFSGGPATNLPAAWSAVHVFRLADGLIVEGWGVADRAGLRAQLAPTPAATERGVPSGSREEVPGARERGGPPASATASADSTKRKPGGTK